MDDDRIGPNEPVRFEFVNNGDKECDNKLLPQPAPLPLADDRPRKKCRYFIEEKEIKFVLEAIL